MTRTEPVRVVVADDHEIWRTGLRNDLGQNFHVVGEAADAAEAIEVIRQQKPELVLCDLHMPDGGGLRVATECANETVVVILTVSEAERDLLDAVAAGAAGYLVKSIGSDELRNALWKAVDGEPVFSPSWRRWSWASSGGCAASTSPPRHCRPASARSCSTWLAAIPTPRSARSSSSHPRRSRTTCGTS